MDRFETLRAFVQVIESGSLTRAADTLGVATSAVSRRLKELEAHLGTQLMQRTTRQLRLTAAGENFHIRAQAILQALEEAEAEAGREARALSGVLRIAAPVSFGTSQLGPILIAFTEANPDLTLDVDFSDRMVDLVAEGHDLAVRIGNLEDSSLIARRITDIRMVVAAAPAFWDKHGRPERPEELEQLPALCYTGTDRQDRWSYTTPDGRPGTMQARVAMRATNGTFLTDAAIAGRGIVMQPSFIVHEAVETGALEPVLCDYAWPRLTIQAVYPQTRHLSARARAFIDFLRSSIGSRPSWEGFLDP
ncbi:MAG: LysR family transcriptional regulator [Pseudomonadota bacterium]